MMWISGLGYYFSERNVISRLAAYGLLFMSTTSDPSFCCEHQDKLLLAATDTRQTPGAKRIVAQLNFFK